MGKKHKDIRCNCGAEFNKPEELAEHYRKMHPNDAIDLYNQVGTVGDKFADIAIRHCSAIARGSSEKLQKQT